MYLFLKVESHVAQLLFHVPNNFALGRSRELISTLGQYLDHIIRQVPPSEVEAQNAMRNGVALVDGHCVRDAVARVEDDARRATGRIQREDGLDRDVERGAVERLEHNLRHLLAVGLRVERRLSEEDGMLLRRDTQFVEERVVPDLLHVIPVGDDTVLDRVFERQDAAFRLCFVSAMECKALDRQ